MLAVESAVVRAGSRTLLRGVSLALAPGRLTCMIGPNGAGKSTLLEVLSGLRRTDEGDAVLEGLPLARWKPEALARRRSVLPQASPLSFPLTALEVVLLGRTPWAGQTNRPRDLDCVHAALCETDTLALTERRYPTLSGGERQRVQLARVLAQLDFTRNEATFEGRFLLLDEPTAALDIAHQHAFLRTAQRLAQRGAAVLAIVHDPNLALLYADHVVMLSDGRIAARGDPRTVVTAERMRRIFGIEVAIERHPARDRVYAVPL